jgi:putative PIN family toxin of toxin-antitoxin system
MLPLRLVLDTNVLVSAALKPKGLQGTTLSLALTKPARLFCSPAIMAEYRDVLARPELPIRKGTRLQLLQLIRNRSYLTKGTHRLEICSDPDDNRFLEVADRAGADYLITGNQRHFPAFWKKTKIITSREFVALAAPHLLRRWDRA